MIYTGVKLFRVNVKIKISIKTVTNVRNRLRSYFWPQENSKSSSGAPKSGHNLFNKLSKDDREYVDLARNEHKVSLIKFIYLIWERRLCLQEKWVWISQSYWYFQIHIKLSIKNGGFHNTYYVPKLHLESPH